MRRFTAIIVLLCLGLSAATPGVCAGVPAGHAVSAQHDAGLHGDHAGHHGGRHDAAIAGSGTVEGGTAGNASHHDGGCTVMIHCQATGLPAAAGLPAFPAGHGGAAEVAAVVVQLSASPATDTPPPKLAC